MLVLNKEPLQVCRENRVCEVYQDKPVQRVPVVNKVIRVKRVILVCLDGREIWDHK